MPILTPEIKYSKTISKLKEKYIPTASKIAMHLALILIASFIASWVFEYVQPSSVPEGVSDKAAYSNLQIVAGFILVAIVLLLGYTVFIFSNIVKFRKESMKALSVMAKEMESNLHKDHIIP